MRMSLDLISLAFQPGGQVNHRQGHSLGAHHPVKCRCLPGFAHGDVETYHQFNRITDHRPANPAK